ncbi:BrnT family toxin [Azospirillum argentinense]
MMIVYDPPKREANLLKHGLDFADLEDGAFFETAVVRPAKDGRFMAIGRLADGTISVVFALLGTEGISIISMRPASKKERSLLP